MNIASRNKKKITINNFEKITNFIFIPIRIVYQVLFKKRKISCNKCKTIIISYYACPKCGYKTLSKKESQLNINYQDLSQRSYELENRAYEFLEIDEKLAYISDIGEQHHENQDSGSVQQLGEWKFLGVSDGVSRSNSPKLASSFALSKSYEYLQKVDLNESNISSEIKNAIQFAHEQIKATKIENFNFNYDPPEATIVIALVKNYQAYIGWVGDSRAYLIDNIQSKILTRDDSWVMVAIENGMSFKDANESPMAHAITQCLGMPELPIVPHVIHVDITNKDLLLCSDGLWNYFDDEQLIHNLYKSSSGSSKETGTKLVNAANLEGGRDNITVAIIKN